MRCLLTGHKGFIGSNLHNELRCDGIDLKENGDIRSYNFDKKYDVIFHCAAQASIPKSFEDPLESHSHNVTGTLRILEHARKTGATVVFSSSSSVYDPVSPYAIQKKMCEDYMRCYWSLGVKSVALRYFNVFGEGQELANEGYSLVLSRFFDQYQKGEPFTIYGTGEQRRDFVYVGDVVQANLMAAKFLETAEYFETFDIGTGVNWSILEVAEMISEDHPKKFLPPRVEPFQNRADITKARALLKWEPKTALPQWLLQSLLLPITGWNFSKER